MPTWKASKERSQHLGKKLYSLDRGLSSSIGWRRNFLSCKSSLILGPSFSLKSVLTMFSARFFSQCMTSTTFLISRSYMKTKQYLILIIEPTKPIKQRIRYPHTKHHHILCFQSLTVLNQIHNRLHSTRLSISLCLLLGVDIIHFNVILATTFKNACTL